MDEPRSTVTTKAFTLYPTQEYIVRQVSNAFFEGNESQAVRHMINFFAEHNVVGGEGLSLTPLEKAMVR